MMGGGCIPSDAQDVLLALYPEINPGNAWRIIYSLDSNGLAAYKESTLSPYISPYLCFFSFVMFCYFFVVVVVNSK